MRINVTADNHLSKYRNNLINLAANVGREAFNEGAEILPPLSLPDLQARQSEGLQDYSEVYWAGPIQIGSNSRTLVIDFDSESSSSTLVSSFSYTRHAAGSSDLWVPSINCTAAACNRKHKYNPKESTTSQRQSGQFSIKYGDGSGVSGPIYTDTGPLHPPPLSFAPPDSLTFLQSPSLASLPKTKPSPP